MSLINDALKKTQRLQSEQQPGSAPQPAPGAPASPPAALRRGTPIGIEPMLLGALVAVVVIVSATVVAVLVFRKEPKPVIAAAAPVAAPAAAVPSAPAPSVATTPAPQPEGSGLVTYNSPAVPKEVAAPVTTPPPAPTPAPQPAMVQSEPVQPAASQPQPAAPAPQPPAPAPSSPTVSIQLAASAQPAPPPAVTPPPVAPVTVAPAPAPPQTEMQKQNIKVLTFIDKLKIAGVRAAGADSKVLMNDRVYRVNDMVDYELGLRLTAVTTASLSFRDDSGTVYTKTF